MGPDAELSALEWLREAGEDELAACFRDYADLDRSRRLARRIRELVMESSAPDSIELLRQ